MVESATIRERLRMSDEQLASFCAKWHIAEFTLFGSVLRDDFMPDSDIDVLVTWEHGQAPGFDLVTMKNELEQLVGRSVDIVSRRAIEASRNPYRRDEILAHVQVVHAAA